MVLISIQSRYHVKASMVLMRADNLLIQNYIIPLNIMLTHPTVCVSDALTT